MAPLNRVGVICINWEGCLYFLLKGKKPVVEAGLRGELGRGWEGNKLFLYTSWLVTASTDYFCDEKI